MIESQKTPNVYSTINELFELLGDPARDRREVVADMAAMIEARGLDHTLGAIAHVAGMGLMYRAQVQAQTMPLAPSAESTEQPQPEVGALVLHLIAHHLDRIEAIEDTMVIGGITASTKITLRQGGGK